MDLEELKVIWDAETKTPQFTLPPAALHAAIQRRIQESGRAAACRYRVEIALSLAGGLGLLALAGFLALRQPGEIAQLHWPKVAASPGDCAALFVASALWFYLACYLNLARLRLQRCGETFESTLRGEIERALARVEFQERIARGMVWWGFIPAWIALGLGLGVFFHLSFPPAHGEFLAAGSVLAASVLAVAFVAEVRCRRNMIEQRYEPHRRELESLLRKLAPPPA